MTTERLVAAFADAGVLCAEQGVLVDALVELDVRLAVVGCDLDDLIAQRWEVDPRFVAKKPVVPVKPAKPKPRPIKSKPTRKGTR